MIPCRPAALSIVLVLAVFAAAGCGGEDGSVPLLDAKRAERNITQGVKASLGVTLDVECPQDRARQRGDRFDCRASSRDTDDLVVHVRQTNDAGAIRWDARVLSTDQYETTISQYIEQQRKIKVTISCPDAVPIKAGDTFTCVAREPTSGETRDVEVTQEDDHGHITFAT